MGDSTILVTGAAGFIGFHVSGRLLTDGMRVVGVDNLSDYYEPALKEARLAKLAALPGFRFQRGNIEDREGLGALFEGVRPSVVVHLAAQAGVRYSVTHPHAYSDSNLSGFVNVLECCRRFKVEHLVYASSSSVYGLDSVQPFKVGSGADRPVSLYAATKRANELMAYAYSHLYGIPSTGLRLFTVYGPWGRPDMALFKFTKAILASEAIEVYGEGQSRDFTHVDDVVEALVRVVRKPPTASLDAPHRIYNVGCGRPVALLDFIRAIEAATGRTASLKMVPAQPGDVVSTWADTEELWRDFSFRPRIELSDGVAGFVRWYRDYYGL